ncbi:hypothetical protein QN277_009093 [Acacia crassicarpa]|uniref:ABC transmembrane type-1 domain-containing protein n=1 Tax=Acacia crassicarpa TaxID=499986 RepID=A0AAE1MDT3_9FABA|nr:hypothetical protein QN277_009093 [Acacia crassicarpa]
MGENGLDGHATEHDKATTSKNHTETNTNEENREMAKQKGKADTVPFHKLFSFADYTDILLMIAGTIGGIRNGMALPLMMLLIGKMINAFGNNQHSSDITAIVSKVSLNFVYLAVGSGVAAFLQVSCWMITGERQAARG